MSYPLGTMSQLSSNPPPMAARYQITRPGKAARAFDASSDAVEFLVDNPGPAKLYGPDGSLLMTKGTLERDLAHRSTEGRVDDCHSPFSI